MTDDEQHDPSTAVTVAYIHDGEKVDYSFHHSLFYLMAFDLGNKARLWNTKPIQWRCGTDGLPDARNGAVQHFLADGGADWLFWVDSDMGFAADTVDQLLAAADPQLRPIVSGLTFANRDAEEDGMGGRFTLAAPVIMDWKHIDGEVGFDIRWNYAQNAIVRCDGVGSACVLVHRSVFERIAAEFGPNWYTRTRNPSTGQMISEDLSFCVRANALEIPIHVHTGVKTTHAKPVWLGEDQYWEQRALRAAPAAPEPGDEVRQPGRDWTVPRYAIVPTHNRPARLLALVVSLGAQCDRIVVLDNASTPSVDEKYLQSALPEACTVEVIRDEEQPPNLARFWNVMFDRCATVQKESRGGEIRHARDCALVTTHHLTCTCRAFSRCYDVAVLNDDSVVPAGWYNAASGPLREHLSAAVAHTGDRPIPAPDLLTDFNFDRSRRMAPHAFVVRGEAGLRADESMRWWYFDDDFCRQAILAGGVLGVPGPVAVNAQANSSTVGPLAEQAQRDRDAFEKKWAQR